MQVWHKQWLTWKAPYNNVTYKWPETILGQTLSDTYWLFDVIKTAATTDPEKIYSHFPFMAKKYNLKARFLSGGEQQMISIGRALMGNPSLLLIDEPSEGLAPLIVNEVRDILAKINSAGVSVLLVEHNYKVATSLARRVYLMGKAHIGYEGTVNELKADPKARSKYLEV